MGAILQRLDEPPAPVTPPPSDLHLPDRIHKPDPWSQGTGDLGEIGPLAAIGSAERLRASGWSDEVESYALYGVSAVDGTVRFLDFDLDEGLEEPWDGPTTALSPDGTKVAFSLQRSGPPQGVTEGWAVYDTVSGDVTEIRDPDVEEVAPDLVDLSFTGDSRYLVTNYAPADEAQDFRSDSLVLWDIKTGERAVAEGPGKYWLPNVGSAPTGVLWADIHKVHHFNPATGERSDFRLPRAVVEPTLGPDGQAFAYIGGEFTPGPDGGINGDTWRLYVGVDRHHLREVDLRPDVLGYFLGWRDETHVVVSDWSKGVASIDVTTGEVERLALPDGNGRYTLATDLLANHVVDAVEPAEAQDPRTWWRRGASAAGLLAAAGLLIWRRRARG